MHFTDPSLPRQDLFPRKPYCVAQLVIMFLFARHLQLCELTLRGPYYAQVVDGKQPRFPQPDGWASSPSSLMLYQRCTYARAWPSQDPVNRAGTSKVTTLGRHPSKHISCP